LLVLFRKPEKLDFWVSRPSSLACCHFVQQLADFLRRSSNFLALLPGAQVIGFRSRQCRFPNHNGQLIVDAMEDLFGGTERSFAEVRARGLGEW